MTSKGEAGKTPDPAIHWEPWPDQHLEVLRQLVAEGLTSGQVAKHPDLEGRYTRAAIMGKSRRLGLHWKREGHGGRKPPPPPPPPRTRPKYERIKLEDVPPPPEAVEQLAPIFRLKHNDCRFILRGQGLDAVYCGDATTSETSSWCSRHRAIVFIRDSGRRVA
jgi:hypothetical protein